MALSADYQLWGAMEGTGGMEIEGQSSGTLTFFRGALAHIAAPGGAGKLLISNADTTEFFGICTKKSIVTVDQPVPCHVRGVVWIGGNTALTLANMGKTMAATAADDSPASIVASTAGTPGALGRLLAVIVTGASGYIDLEQRSLVVNA